MLEAPGDKDTNPNIVLHTCIPRATEQTAAKGTDQNFRWTLTSLKLMTTNSPFDLFVRDILSRLLCLLVLIRK